MNCVVARFIKIGAPRYGGSLLNVIGFNRYPQASFSNQPRDSVPPYTAVNNFMEVMMNDSRDSENSFREAVREELEANSIARSHNFNRTLRREFGPAAYGVFLAKNVKASRGVRGKSYTIRINDTKWRYPKRGRH